MKLKTFFLLVIVLCSGCVPKVGNEIKTIDLFSKSSGEINYLSDIATNVEYIPLQTTDSLIIGHISDLKTYNNNLFINGVSELFCFDKSGVLLNKLNKKGRGPGEYQTIMDFYVSIDSNLLAVLSGNKIITYKNKGNQFEYSNSLNLHSAPASLDLTPNQNSVLLTYLPIRGNEPFSNILFSLIGDTLDTRLNYYKYYKTDNGFIEIMNENFSYSFRGNIFFKEIFSDTVFTVDRFNKIKPYLVLYSHGKGLTSEARFNTEYFNKFGYEYVKVFPLLELERYIIYKYSYKKEYYGIIYDKTSDKKFEFNTKTFLKDDIIGGINFEPKFCSENFLYSWIDIISLKKYVESESFKNSVVKDYEKKIALKLMVDSLKATDNPVIIRVTPKSN